MPATATHAPVELALDFLATYRLTTLLKDDLIMEDLRSAVFRRFGPPDAEHPHKVSYLFSCPWCLSIYLGAVATLGRRYAPAAWRPLARVLALSALTGLVAEGMAVARKRAEAPPGEPAPGPRPPHALPLTHKEGRTVA